MTEQEFDKLMKTSKRELVMEIWRFTLGRVKTARIFYGIDLSEQECEK